jgi:hypothetical protein
MAGREKASEKMCVIKPTYQHLAAFVFVHSVFGEKFPTAEFFNDIGRNSLLGNTVERK